MRLAAELLRWRPRVCYVFDMAAAGVLSAAIAKALTRCRVIVDTGDAITALAWSLGRSPLGRLFTRLLQGFSLAIADRLVVRGSYHREWLRHRGYDADVIRDGVDLEQFTPLTQDELRLRLGLDRVLTIGLVGSSIWSQRLQQCYGWDLVEVIRILKERPVAGVIIGDGSGIAILQNRCREYGIEDRIHFLGRIPYEQLPRYVNLLDICLSTQTDDLVGRVRTTGKLPLYLACGRFVLASQVGEAARVLPAEMLVEYRGTVDPSYPDRLAERILRLFGDTARSSPRSESVTIARTHFSYDYLAARVAAAVEGLLLN